MFGLGKLFFLFLYGGLIVYLDSGHVHRDRIPVHGHLASVEPVDLSVQLSFSVVSVLNLQKVGVVSRIHEGRHVRPVELVKFRNSIEFLLFGTSRPRKFIHTCQIPGVFEPTLQSLLVHEVKLRINLLSDLLAILYKTIQKDLVPLCFARNVGGALFRKVSESLGSTPLHFLFRWLVLVGARGLDGLEFPCLQMVQVDEFSAFQGARNGLLDDVLMRIQNVEAISTQQSGGTPKLILVFDIVHIKRMLIGSRQI